jgi:hypothetical protein
LATICGAEIVTVTVEPARKPSLPLSAVRRFSDLPFTFTARVLNGHSGPSHATVTFAFAGRPVIDQALALAIRRSTFQDTVTPGRAASAPVQS